MKSTVCALAAAVILTVPMSAADPPGFKHWKAAELKQHDAELPKHMAADHSSRETLADYGDHRFRMLYRDADGNPEQHDAIIDIVYVQSGSGTLVMGGTMVARKERIQASGWALGSRGATRTPSAPVTSCTFQPASPTASCAEGPAPDLRAAQDTEREMTRCSREPISSFRSRRSCRP